MKCQLSIYENIYKKKTNKQKTKKQKKKKQKKNTYINTKLSPIDRDICKECKPRSDA